MYVYIYIYVSAILSGRERYGANARMRKGFCTKLSRGEKYERSEISGQEFDKRSDAGVGLNNK